MADHTASTSADRRARLLREAREARWVWEAQKRGLESAGWKLEHENGVTPTTLSKENANGQTQDQE